MRKFKLLLMVFFLGLISNTWAQTTKVSGVVLDDLNQGLPGVTVTAKGEKAATITDEKGHFSFAIPAGVKKLQFSFVGFTTQEIAVTGAESYSVKLVSASTTLNDVVVIGYGTAKKKDVTGSVVSMSAAKLTEQKKTSVAEAMQGQMAGVDVSRTSSKPGAGLSIKIRGNTVIQNVTTGSGIGDGISDVASIDLSKPLYVVDGVFLDDIAIINPSDIQQLDVLKDASATAIYGSRGANGVVIITTKSGVAGKMVVTYDGSIGINNVARKVDMKTGDEYVAFVDDMLRGKQWTAAVNAGNGTVDAYNNFAINTGSAFVGASEQANVANRNYTDWQDLLIHKNTLQSNHNLGISGGKDGLTYNAGIGATLDNGLTGIQQYNRYTMSAAISNKFNDKVTMGARAYYTLSDRETGSLEIERSAWRLTPTLSATNPDGSYVFLPDAADARFVNPLVEAQEGNFFDNTRTSTFIGNVFIKVQPTSWVTLNTNFAPQSVNTRYGQYVGKNTKTAYGDVTRTRARFNEDNRLSYNWDNSADFKFDLAEGHKLKALVIASLYSDQNEGNKIYNTGFTTDLYKFYNIRAGLNGLKDYDSYYSKESMVSFTARVNYDLFDKYLFTATGRYDGSSKLAAGHQWAFFPSAAFAWKVSNEDFMKDVSAKYISDLKVRLSYGQSGNNAPVSRYASQQFLNQVDYLWGDTATKGYSISSLFNPELGWEVSTEYNLGFNFATLNNRVTVDMEFYNKKTKDALLNRSLMLLTGYAASTGNYGSVLNRGIEISLNTTNIKTADFTWTTNFNFSKNHNEILELAGGLQKQTWGPHNILQVGSPVDAIYSYEKVGIWQMDEIAEARKYNAVPGQYKYVDQNKDGVINLDDKVVIGSNSPDWIGGMTNTFSYKNFDFSFLIYTRQGATGHSEFYEGLDPSGDKSSFNVLNLDYWTPNNQGGTFQMPSLNWSSGAGQIYTYQDYSFVKVGNIGLGYNMPQSVLDSMKISQFRLSLDIQNPFCWSKYKGPDPETALQNTYGMGNSITTTVLGLKIKI